MSYESPAPTPSPHRTTFDTRLAYIQSQSQSQNQSTNTGGSGPSGSSVRNQDARPHHQNSLSTSSSTPLRPPSRNSRPPNIISHPGCVLCSLVSSTFDQLSSSSPSNSPNARSSLLPPSRPSGETASAYHQPFERSTSPTPAPRRLHTGGKEVIFQDADITIYRAEGKERLCSDGRHLIVVVNKHLESVYDFGPSDVPMLSHILEITHRLLLPVTGQSSSSASDAERGKGKGKENDVRIGFVGSVTKDPQSPHAHLHAHAMVGPIDTSLPGATFWRRNVVFGSMNWWSIEDLRAEIREESSNNRVKSGYQNRERAPIDRVPDAGSIAGLPNALDPSDYSDHPPPNSASRPDQLARNQSQAKRPNSSLRNHTSSGEAFDTPSKGKQVDRSGNAESAHSRRSEEGEDDYVAVDLEEIPSNDGKASMPVSRVERGGRI
ncbi:uncharacterized protein I303_104379 [Kwoniella dejecticola CBS 10117]|uniref:HIT domain-containing protein n=1 Tax=Kwoniella dejecticola CBS 10117 TaxID=1296121 RepID=A0A1A6A5H6_9TREE|nr:uncharacterized protein I303_04644 [Kwoniella dejecticola CBS 10117]OBR85309.1 hypothetical protein I303_04644 [Kwoniella dejecticola CBS 10117]